MYIYSYRQLQVDDRDVTVLGKEHQKVKADLRMLHGLSISVH